MSELKDFKFVATLEFKKIQSDDKTLYSTFYSTSKAETIINESDTDDVFESICSTITSNIQKSLGQGSVWIIDSVIIIIHRMQPSNNLLVTANKLLGCV